MAKYGKTWWGEQWLNALQNIDFSNRLPRGRAYAGNGSVRSIQIDGNLISAKVQGSRRTPYKIDIRIPAFTISEQDIIIEAVSANQLILSRLLNRELPQELLSIIDRRGIKLFPSTWRDLQMNCSCPDWAVPCKHLAAVIYLIANEIDKNPFLVFQLHGFDILKRLSSKGLEVDKHSKETIFDIENIFETDEDKGTISKNVSYNDLNFASIPNLADTFSKLLAPSPVFYEADFRDLLEKQVRSVARFAKGHSIGNTDFVGSIQKGSGIIFTFDSSLSIDSIHIVNHNVINYKGDKLLSIFTDIASIASRNELHLYDTSLRLVWDIHCFCQMLCTQSAIVPQLVSVKGQGYKIRWIPALLSKQVNEQFRILTGIVAQNSIVKISSKISSKDDSRIKPSEQLALLCSAIIANWFRNFINSKIDYRSFYQIDDIRKLFFFDQIVEFKKRENESIPNAIELWLRRLFITEKPTVPILRIDEVSSGFEVNVEVEVRVNGNCEVVDLNIFLSNSNYKQLVIPFLKDLAQLADYLPELNSIIDGNKVKAAFISVTNFAKVLVDVLPVIQLLGVTVALPSSLKYLIRPAVGLKVDTKGKVDSQGFVSIHDMLSYRWGISIGDQTIDPNEFFTLVQGKSGLVKLRNQYLLISDNEIESLRKRILQPAILSPMDLLRASVAEELDDIKVDVSQQLQNLLSNVLQVESIDVPKGIKANLRPYQILGYQWIVKNSRLGFGSLIADDMGLGKTLQVIASLQYFKDTGLISKKQKALVVVPTTLITNWHKEISKFAPNLNSVIYHGSNRALPDFDFDILLTSYGLLRNDTDVFAKQKWYALVIDESQNIKNPSTAQTKAIKKIKADVKIAMSGTPVENRLSDYWSVFDFTNKGYLGSLKTFQEKFAIPIQKWHNHERTEVFRKATRPFLLRRLKTDKSIINDLPEKVENTLYCNLTVEQATIYQNVVDHTMKDIEANEGIARKGLVLKLITALKQICNHPTQYLKKGNLDIDLSGKCQLITSLLENTIDSGEKTLIFTQYKEMGEILVKMLNQRFGFEPLFLHGGLTRKVRDTMVDEFNTKSQHSIFILSLKAGGTGLNLTSACNVIHFDLWWNPAVEAQATDRAYRIGQTRNVMVYRALCKGTFEERINEMLISKRELANLTVEAGESWVGNLSNDELRELIKLGV